MIKSKFRERAQMTTLPALDVTIQRLQPQARLPEKAHPSDACFDLRAAAATMIPKRGTGFVSLGWAMQLQEGWEALVRGRSGLASKGILAHMGTIDHLYRQEVKVILHNLSDADFYVEVGDRVAQMTFAPVYPVTLREGEIELTARGGFGSTGVK